MVQVGLTVTSNNALGNNILIEEERPLNRITFRLDLDEAAPAGGLTVYLEGDLSESLNNYVLSQTFDAANSVNIELAGGDPAFPFVAGGEDEFIQGDFDFTGLALTIREGETFGTVTLDLFDGPDPDPVGPAGTLDGLRTVTYSLRTRDQIDPQDLDAIEPGNGDGVDVYTIDPNAASSGPITLVDTASQLPPSDPPVVSVSVSQDILIEEQAGSFPPPTQPGPNGITTVTFNLDTPAPTGGLIVSVSNKAQIRPLGDFDPFPPFPQTTFTNSELVQGFAGNDGLTVRIFEGETTASFTLPIFDDPDRPSTDPNATVNDDIGVEQQTWTLDPQVAIDEGLTVGDYVVDSSAGTFSLTIADTAGQLNAPVAGDDTGTTDENVVLNISAPGILDNDSDPDTGDTLSVSAINGQAANVGTEITLASGALLTVNADGSYDYNPNGAFDSLNNGDTATDSFEYTVTDGNQVSEGVFNEDTGTVTITINGVGVAQSPPTATTDTATVNEDDSVNIAVLANDTDPNPGDVLSVDSVTQGTNGSVTINADNTVTYTPNADFNGTDTFSYTVSDGNGGTDTADVNVTIDPVNDAPVANNDTDSTSEDVAVDIDVLANDTDVDTGDVLSVDSVTQGANGSVSINGDGTVNYDPNAGFFGTDTFTYTVSDGNGGTDTADVTVTVSEIPNNDPVANNDDATVNEDSSVDIAVLGNDTDADPGDVLSVTDVTQGANGAVTINADNTVNYAPNADFNGTDSFTYTISDGQGGSSTATVNVTIDPVNDAPAATNDTGSTTEGTAVDIDVLANDTDIDTGDVLSVDNVTQGANGTVTINADNTVNYNPNAGFFGTDTFTYTVSDGNGGTDTADVTVTVTDIPNNDPVANNDDATVNEDSSVDIAVLGNDTDADPGDVLSVTEVTQGANGAVTINADNTVNYAPNADFNGTDAFTYTISDGQGGSSTATVNVTIDPVNDAPVATDDSSNVPANGSADIDVLGNDIDVDTNDVLTVDSVTQGTSGTVTINADNTVNYAPNAGFVGNDSFTYTVSDGNGGTDTATVNVTVDGGAVVAVDDTATVNEDDSVNIDVLGNDTDPNPGVDSVTQGANGTVTINGDGTVNYAPNADFNGTDSFEYTISDGSGGTSTATVNVTIDPVNDAPVAGDDAGSTQQGTAVDIDVLANDTDVDGDALAVDSVTQAANGTVTINADNTVNYNPNAGFSGTDTFSYTVSDGNGGTDTADVTVSVANGNGIPVAGDDTATTDEDSAVDIAVLANDTDPDGDVLSVTDVTQAANGSVTINADNTVNYAPNADFNGTDIFTYTISDGNGGTSTATVNVTIDPVNDAPVAGDDTGSTQQDTAVDINVLANDTDVDAGDVLSVDSITQGSSGTVTINADNTINYNPNAGFTGTDTFSYTVSDGNGGTDTADVTVTVDPDQGGNEIVGTAGKDFLRGTNDDDIIRALGGRDTVIGRNGDDRIEGDGGRDRLFGGNGNDTVFGGDGKDFIFGQSGKDVISGDNGKDFISGGAGNDSIFGGEGKDTILGNSGNDLLSGDAGDDRILGGSGDDTIMGVTGNDILFGNSGKDVFVFGNGDGKDFIFDFSTSSDKIGLVEGELTFADLSITQSGRNTVLGVSSTGEDLAVLRRVNASALTEDLFVTVPDVSDINDVL